MHVFQHGGHITKDLFGVPGVLGGGAWTPASLPSLLQWLDASDSTTLFQDSAGTTPAAANNDVVGRWNDKSGNAYHGTQATTARKPILLLNQFNGLPAVRASDTYDALVFPPLSTSATFTIYAVVAANNLAILLAHVWAQANYGVFLGGTFENRGMGVSDGTTRLFADGATKTTALAVYTWQRNALYLNGASLTSIGDPEVGALANITTLFARPAGSELASVASIGEWLVYDTTHDAATRAQVWAYLNSKWGVY